MTNPAEQARERTWAEIDLGALDHNLNVVRARQPHAGIMAVVKADAYGHGLETIASALTAEVDALGVATLSEARTLHRTLGTACPPILLMGAALPHDLPEILQQGWHLSISTLSELETASQVAAAQQCQAQVHLMVDTGMGRLGCLETAFPNLCRAAQAMAHLRVRGLASHLPSADENTDFTLEQLTSFEHLVEEALTCWPEHERPIVHIRNSAGVMGYPQTPSYKTLLRPGLMLYGIAPVAADQPALKPVLTLKTRVRLVRTLPPGRGISYGRTFITPTVTTVATLGIGYGDGYPRALSGRETSVLIHGHRCPLLGRVTMDQIMVDVSQVNPDVSPGTEVVVYGQQHSATISVAEIASKSGTIPWEILTSITKRVPRVVITNA